MLARHCSSIETFSPLGVMRLLWQAAQRSEVRGFAWSDAVSGQGRDAEHFGAAFERGE